MVDRSQTAMTDATGTTKYGSIDKVASLGEADERWWKTVTPYKVYVIILLFLTYLLNHLDRHVLIVNAKAIAQEIHYGDKSCMSITTFSKTEKNSIYCPELKDMNTCTHNTTSHDGEFVPVCKWDYDGQGLQYQILASPAFIIIHTIAGIFLSFLASKSNRKVLLGICLIYWSAMTMLTGLVQEYRQLVAVRFALGLGEAGCTPLAISIITDYFTQETLGMALGIYSLGIYVGSSLCDAEHFIEQGWRRSFFLSGVPGFLMGILILLTLKEPERKTSDSNASTKMKANAEDSTLMDFKTKTKRALKRLFTRSLLLICLAGSIRNSGKYVFDYNILPYFDSIGQSEDEISLWFVWVPLVGGSLSVIFGGIISDRVVKKCGIRGRIAVIILSLLIATAFAAGILFVDPPGAYIFMIPTSIFGEMWLGITLAVIIESVPVDNHLVAVVLYRSLTTLFGGNIPLIFPSLENLYVQFGYSRSDALRNSLSILYLGAFICGAVLFFLSLFFVEHDKTIAEREDLRSPTNRDNVAPQ